MKTLFQLNTRVNCDSTGRIAEEIGKLAIANGWRSIIAFGRDERLSLSETFRVGDDWDIRWHGLQTRLFDRHGLGSVRSTERLICQIEAIKPDIIQLHNLHGSYVNINVLFEYLKTCGRPVFWTFHDCWPITGHCVHFDYVGCEKWKTQCHHCPQKTTHPVSYGLDRSFKNYKLKKALFSGVPDLTIIPVSEWLGGILRHSFLKGKAIKVIHNGVDTTVFKPLETTIASIYGLENSFILLAVANKWSQRKGFFDLIELSKQLDDDCRLVIIGVNKKQQKKLPKHVIGLSRTENLDTLVEFYSIADVVLNLSYEETFGLTTVEGFSCGTPGIAYNVTASPELIDSTTGFVVEKGRIDEVLKAVHNLRAKGKSFYKEACLRKALLLYNKSINLQSYIDLYEEKIAAR